MFHRKSLLTPYSIIVIYIFLIRIVHDVLNVNEAVQKLNSQFLLKFFLSCDKTKPCIKQKGNVAKNPGSVIRHYSTVWFASFSYLISFSFHQKSENMENVTIATSMIVITVAKPIPNMFTGFAEATTIIK